MASLQCQRCKTAIKIDESLQDLNPASFKLLADAGPTLEPKSPDQPRSATARERHQHYKDVTQNAGPYTPDRTGSVLPHSTGKSQPPEMSYIMLTDSHLATDVVEKESGASKQKATDHNNSRMTIPKESKLHLSQQMSTAMKLFNILSSRSDIDHPVCSDCTEILLEGLQKRQTNVIRERDAYVEFLKQAQEDIPTEEEKAKIKQGLEDANQRERVALKELEDLEVEKRHLEEEIAELDAESARLDAEEESFWRDRNGFTSEMRAFQEQRDSLQNQLSHDSKVLEALQRTNVFNDAFCIAHDGFFATINGLRLGRLPDHPVEWPEINAALGQTVLLLAIVSEKLECKYKQHSFVPMGSTSKLIVEEGKHAQSAGGKTRIFELYSSGDLPLGLGGLFQGKFDNAMVELLSCLRQLGEHVGRKSAGSVVLPYRIEKDKIGDVSIRLSYGHDEQWTRACKYLLTCCKFLLAHASHVDDAKRSGR